MPIANAPVQNYASEYGGIKYRVDGGILFTVLVNGEALINFDNEDSMKAFIDSLNSVVDTHIMPPMLAHLRGCGRCRRTAAGIKPDPCKTGIPLFQATKMNVMSIAKSHAESVKETRTKASNVTAS